MRVPIGDRTYLVSFKNISELREHPPLPGAVVALLEEKQDGKPLNGRKKTAKRLGLIAALKPFIRLKPRRASITTTRCVISQARPDLVSGDADPKRPPLVKVGQGESFYSRAEVQADPRLPIEQRKAWHPVPFDKVKAWRLSLDDALANTFPTDHHIRSEFWHAFEAFLLKRAKQVTRTAESVGAPAGGSVTGSPQGPSA